MKFLLAVALLTAFASPSFAGHRSCVGGTGDSPNHQSSLSSTSAGGSVGYCKCD